MPKTPPFGTATARLMIAAAARVPGLQEADSKRLLFITNRPLGQVLPDPNLLILSLAELCKENVTDFNPDAAVFSLWGTQEDATQVIARLTEIGYRGKCIVVAPPLPRPDLIMAELTAISPGLDLDLITAAAEEASAQSAESR